MQVRSLRMCAAIAVAVIAVCAGISLTKDRTSKALTKTSRIISDSINSKTPNNPSRSKTVKTSPVAKNKPSIGVMDTGSIHTVWFDDALPAGAIPKADDTQTQLTAGFKNAEGFYLTSVNGGGWEVNLNPSGTRGTNENFRLIDVNGGTLESGDSIRLVAKNGTHYVSAHGGGSGWCDQPEGQVFANTTQPGAWETFVIRKANGSTGTIGTNTPITLVSSGNYYFWTEPWSGEGAPTASPNGQLYANRTTVGDWQKFTLEVVAVNGSNAPSKVAFRSSGGFYINAEKGSGWDVNVNETVRDTEQTFDVVDLNGGQLESGDKIRFHKTGACGGGYYLSIYGGGVAQGTPPPNGRAYMRSATPSTNETFTINKADGSSGVIGQGTHISLKTENGFYFTAEGGGQATGHMPPYGRLYANNYVDYYGAVDERVTFTLDLTATPGGGSDELWNWVSSNPAPQSGTKAHQSSIASGFRQHYFTGAATTLSVGNGDHLYAWVYLDPANMPSEIMLQWNDGTNFEHRAYWGANSINLGTDGTESRKYMGGLPAAGVWVKLDIPASAVGLEGKTVNGMAFTQYGGQVTWDQTGKYINLANIHAIVQLSIPYTVETRLTSDAAVQAQRASISQAQNSLLASISGNHNPGSVKTYKTIPYMALAVNSDGYQQLRTSQYVSSVTEDKLVAAAVPENISTIGASAAWQLGYTGAGQTIVIIDTGVDGTHPMLRDALGNTKVVAEACYNTNDTIYDADDNPVYTLTNNCPNATPVNSGGTQYFSSSTGSGVDCKLSGGGTTCDHGTKIAGIAAGKELTDLSGNPQAGVAKDASIISIQVFSKYNASDPTGCQNCPFTFQSDQLSALEYVYTGVVGTEVNGIVTPGIFSSYKIAAINLGRTSDNTVAECDRSEFKSIIQALRDIGIPTITESGDKNVTTGVTEPACVTPAISVGATGNGTDNNSVWSSSSTSGSNSANYLSLLAPGYGITGPIPGGTYEPSTGTSYAVAQVSGAWAIMRQAQPKPTNPNSEKQKALLKTLVEQDLTKFRNNGVQIIDTRPGANNRVVPRIKIDAALSCLPVYNDSQTWVGAYYDGLEFSGKRVLIRDDGIGGGTSLYKNLSDGSLSTTCGPGLSGTGSGMSVRWARKVSLPAANTYGFTVSTDQNVRFYVNGIEKTQGWTTLVGNTRTFNQNITDVSNPITLTLEYSAAQATSTPVQISWAVMPTAPANLTATAISPTEIDLTWSNTSSAEGILIERSQDGGQTYATPPIAHLGPSAASFKDSGLNVVTAYTYRVTAYNNVGSATSNTASATTWKPIPPIPTNLTATALSTSEIRLTWSDNSPYENGFVIQRYPIIGQEWQHVATIGANVTSYIDTGLPSGSHYDYRIKAFNSTGESWYSRSAPARTFEPCTYSVSPGSISVGRNGGSRSISVTTQNYCSWDVSTSGGFISVDGGGGGNGNGTVNVTMSSSSGNFDRYGYISIGPTGVDVYQSTEESASLLMKKTSANGK